MRVKITTTIEEGLLNHAKSLAKAQGFDGVNAIIEKALSIYFLPKQDETWEKSLSSGWVKKLVICEDEIHLENIKCRKSFKNPNPKDYTHEALKSRGWKNVNGKTVKP